MRLNKWSLGKTKAREQKLAGAAIEERVELLGERKVFKMSRKSLVPALSSALINLKEQELLEIKVI